MLLLSAFAATVIGKVIISAGVGTSISLGVKSISSYFSRKAQAEKLEEESKLREQIR